MKRVMHSDSDRLQNKPPRLKRYTRWLGPAVGAVAMNFFLFMLMPCLLRQAPAKTEYDEIVSQIQVVRLKKIEQPARRKAPSPPPKKNAARRPQPATARTMIKKPVWPFEMNNRLPAGPDTVVVPPMQLNVNEMAGLGDLFSMADLDRPLITLSRMPPIYPPVAKRRGIEGWVTVRFIVNAHGVVEDITIIEAQPTGMFEQSVRKCVAGWRFQPGTVQGRPVQVWAETTVRFELD